MAKLNPHIFLTTTLFIILINHINNIVLITADDACPYPCNPPPIAGTNTPTSPSTQTGPYTPPTNSFPPPSDNLPNYPPGAPGTYGGGAVAMPPPPDPILPYFPYYYRNGVHRPSDQSSSSMASSAAPRSTFQLFSAPVVAVFAVFAAYYC